MRRIARDDVTKAVGQADDVTIAKIIATGANGERAGGGQAWLANDEPLLNGRQTAGDRSGSRVVDILSEFEPSEEDEVAGPAVTHAGMMRRSRGPRKPSQPDDRPRPKVKDPS